MYREFLTKNRTTRGMEMNNEMVRRACHAIGMDNKSPFYKFGKKHFISYRNYSVSNRLGDEYFDKMESEGRAESDRGK